MSAGGERLRRNADLAVHLLHRRILLSPILDGEAFNDDGDLRSRASSRSTNDVSVRLTEDHCGAVSALLEPLVAATKSRNASEASEARRACATAGSRARGEERLPCLLPLHVAALHGASHAVLEGLCRAHPEGASSPLLSPSLHPDRKGALPIELFEEGRAGREVNSATDRTFPRLSREYFRRSDLLFSRYPAATSTEGVQYCADGARLARFEERIRREASPSAENNSRVGRGLSDAAGSVWLFLCRGVVDHRRRSGDPSSSEHNGGNHRRRDRHDRLPNFGASVGRILSGLERHSVLRLDFLRTESNPEGSRVPTMANGRTVLEESRRRAPQGSMSAALGEFFFHSSVLAFLEARDALAYSSACRKAWTRGVRLVQRMSNGINSGNNSGNSNGNNNRNKKRRSEAMDFHGSWRISKQSETYRSSESSSMLEERDGKVSQPWQRLELPYVPSCTHTVFISCDVTYRAWDVEEDSGDAQGDNEAVSGRPVTPKGGGLLVLSDGRDARLPRVVAASVPIAPSKIDDDGGEASDDLDEDGNDGGNPRRRRRRPRTSRARFAFNHQRGRDHSLWYYGDERHSLSVSDLSVRQLVYACDYNGHNPLHVLLAGGEEPSNLEEQLAASVRAGFGGGTPAHYALRVGCPERTLRKLIEARPACLLDTDGERRTPLHAALDSGGDRRRGMPTLGVTRALLTSPGENATHLKDASGRLPLHVAAENGACEGLLRALVDAYADGCYRRTDEGDLPVHLLVRSGSATRVTVELLMRPIVRNPTICAYAGSRGVHLPLHIAAEYCCSYKILEGLLASHGEAARAQRQLPRSPSDSAAATSSSSGLRQPPVPRERGQDAPKHALEIFEEGRGGVDGMCLEAASRALERDTDHCLSDCGSSAMALGEADFNLRSDLIFVHNPNVPKSIRPYITTYYRDEKERIERLAAVIKREALQCTSGDTKKRRASVDGERVGQEDADADAADKLGVMARLAWCWMCTNDNYAGVVSDIVLSLPVEAVRFLARTPNPNSKPVPDRPIEDCSSPRCALVLSSRLGFLGRYVLDRASPPLHLSESCAMLRARDIGAAESFLSIRTLLESAEPDIDDYSHGCGSVHAIAGNSVEVDRFAHFARKIGVERGDALAQIEELLRGSDADSVGESNLRASGVAKEAFEEFCRMHDIDEDGCRGVAVKFMRHREGYELERQCRDILDESGNLSEVVPILRHFSFKGDDGNDFARGMFGEGSASGMTSLAGFRFGIVMPCANGNLRDIIYREGISSSNLRENARRVGETLCALHEQGIAHMNLQLKNVLRFGTNRMVLSDFGSSLFLKSIKGVNAIGGSSAKICPSILPPEMIAKIELSNRDSFDQLMRYWKYVHADANCLEVLTSHERRLISTFVDTRAAERSKSPSDPDGGGEMGDARQNGRWKEMVSSLLEKMNVEDLPPTLSRCGSFDTFRAVWERTRQNHELWENLVRPRVDERERCAYVIKAHENRRDGPPRDAALLPYEPVPPSEGTDVWIFGVFLHELCSGVNPFHAGGKGGLRGVEEYARLHGWDREAAERSAREHVQDPLARDLICQTLVPVGERLPSMTEVLKHPFFLPQSVEAQRYLEKYEEMQLLRDNTVSIRKVTKTVTHMLDESMEKYCKLAFATDQIAFPTCLMVLPYGLNFDEALNRPIAAANPRLTTCAVRLGKCLLEINKATARLSFWLMMSGRMRGADGDRFKAQMQDWLKRARYESCASIAAEIVSGLGCGACYAGICEEVLAFDGNVSKAKSYMRDPIRAARRAFKQSAGELSDLYRSAPRLYLVDEATLLPICAQGEGRGSSHLRSTYPMRLEPLNKLIANILLPFMNIVVMKALAKDRFEGLAHLLGLPPSLGIPDSWRSMEPGLVHSNDNSASIEDFVCLQKIIRKGDHDLHEFLDDASAYSRMDASRRSGVSSVYDNASFVSISALGLAHIDLSPGDPAVAAVPMAQLELLFREHDPEREFGRLRRVATGNLRKSPGLWTNTDTIRQLKGMVEMSELEEQLRELKLGLDRTRDAASQYSTLLVQRNALKQKMPKDATSSLAGRSYLLDSSFDEPPKDHAQIYNQREEDDYTRSTKSSVIEEEQPQDERDVDPSMQQGPDIQLEISTHSHRMPPQPAPQPPLGPRRDEDDESGEKKKTKKKRKGFRPWFTAC